jgi:hypothetical protein
MLGVNEMTGAEVNDGVGVKVLVGVNVIVEV